MKRIKILLLTILMSCLFGGCGKEWMAEKRDISIVVPSSLKDARKLLNDSFTLRKDHRMLASLATDEYYINDATYKGVAEAISGQVYLWKDPTLTSLTTEIFWGGPYKQVFYANIILECLDKLKPRFDQIEEYNDIKGAALFLRARAFYSLAVQFSEPYRTGQNDEVLGIPIRLKSDIKVQVKRNTLKETYSQIISDLKEAIVLLRENVPQLKLIISKPAALGLLARCYLSLADYTSAYEYANTCLGTYSELIDFNFLDKSLRFPIPLNNKEVIHDADMQPIYINNIAPYGIVENRLYSLYENNDTRRTVLFQKDLNDTFSFRGVYLGNIGSFAGVAVNEMYLIRAECAARLEKYDIALNDMNTLLVNRYETGTFVPWVFTTKEELITKILLERRKELLFRGLRWEDLRRLNREPGREETLTRTVNGVTYTLEPNDPRYVFKIPEQVILETGIQQND